MSNMSYPVSQTVSQTGVGRFRRSYYGGVSGLMVLSGYLGRDVGSRCLRVISVSWFLVLGGLVATACFFLSLTCLCFPFSRQTKNSRQTRHSLSSASLNNLQT
jgi:hypothetical protein